MRLVCPNCEAKYEVPEDAIPDSGRDVQCTNCGHSWYQMRGRLAAAPFVAPVPEEPAAPAIDPRSEPLPETAAAPKPVSDSPFAEQPVAIDPEDAAPIEAVATEVAEPADAGPGAVWEAEQQGRTEAEAAPSEAEAVTETAPDAAIAVESAEAVEAASEEVQSDEQVITEAALEDTTVGGAEAAENAAPETDTGAEAATEPAPEVESIHAAASETIVADAPAAEQSWGEAAPEPVVEAVLEPEDLGAVTAATADEAADEAAEEFAALQDAEAPAESAAEEPIEPAFDITPAGVVEDFAGVDDTMREAESMTEANLDIVAEVEAEATAAASATVDDMAEMAEATAVSTPDDTPAPAPDYAVDESVLAILREEAEREANARRAEALESQTDLGIDAAMPLKRAAVLSEAESRASARRDLLPDVEEINSTLRPSEMQAAADGAPDFAAMPPKAPRGFRSGFLSLMTIAILAAALYVVAPRLAIMVPALAGPLETYVSIIDSLRLGLDGIMRSATVAISDG